MRLCRALRIGYCTIDPETQQVKMSNMTIINYALFALGPMREDRLTLTLLAVQGACSLLALLARYQLPGLFYDIVK